MYSRSAYTTVELFKLVLEAGNVFVKAYFQFFQQERPELPGKGISKNRT
jgi:hypothetical protein